MARKIRIGELLVRQRVINETQLQEALDVQRRSPAPLGSIIVRLGYTTDERVLTALANHARVRPWFFDEPTDPAAIEKVPASICRDHQVLPVAIQGDMLVLAMVDPDDIETQDVVRYAARMRVEPVLADREKLLKAIGQAHGQVGPAVEDLVDQALKDFQVEKTSTPSNERSTLTEAETRPVVGLVNQVLADAIRMSASDIHIEPRADRVDIRYRIDGQLRKVKEFPTDLLPMVVTRLKIMAEIDIVEWRIPQDGRISAIIDGRGVDLRMSVLPSHHGQRIVLRVLDKANSLKRLEELGFANRNLDIFRGLVTKPYGLFLVTGPTGSGKTTTLYAALSEIRDESNNVMTCEDPIEYELDGVNQSQVNEKVGLTFARQLRAILRQDPDVVLVGEIRDAETAETALRASITGHMVLSTLHCNDAPGAIPRLLDMGIDSFMLSTGLVGSMSQRLIRLLCPLCKRRRPTTPAEQELMRAYGFSIYEMCEPVGCPNCTNGYKGRKAVHEIMPVTPSVARMIAAHDSMESVIDEASKYGYAPMQERALELIQTGITSLDEARRVIFFDIAHGLAVSQRAA